MTATEGRIKPQSISDDVRAIEEALAAKDGDYIAYVAEVSEPARLRRVLDTMQTMGEALKAARGDGRALRVAGVNNGKAHIHDQEAIIDARWRELDEGLRAALALYEGMQ